MSQERRIKCRSCAMAGKKSKVYPSYNSVLENQEGGFLFYDEDGRFHSHTTGITAVEYKCSAGHEWNDSEDKSACWCGWKGEPVVK